MSPPALSARAIKWVPFVLVTCTGVSIFSTDLYVPSLDSLVDYFDTTPERVYLTLSLNLVAASFAVLFYGPASELLGRKFLLLCGLSAFFLASVAATVAPTIELLIVARVVQGLGTSVASVVIVPTIRSLFSEKEALKVMGYFGMAIGIAPTIAPILGGYMHVWFGWRSNFLLLCFLAAGVWLLVRKYVPETVGPKSRLAATELEQSRVSLRPRALFDRYAEILKCRAFLSVWLPAGISFGSLFTFISAGPFVIVGYFGVPPERYGLYFFVLVGGYVLGSFSVSQLAKRNASPLQVFRVASLLLPIAGIVVLAPILLGYATLQGLLIGMAITGYLQGLTIATSPIALLSVLPPGIRHGPTIALLSSFQFLCAGLAGVLCGAFQDGTPAPLAWVLFLMTATVGILVATFGKETLCAPAS